MEPREYSLFVENNSGIFKELLTRKIFFVSDLIKGGMLQSLNFLEFNASCFDASDLPILEKLINSPYFFNKQQAQIINTVKAVSIFKLSDSKKSDITALQMSRVSFMGTDGMRGKISTDKVDNCVSSFFKSNILTADLIEITTYAFSSMLLKNGVIDKSAVMCVGNDGRDLTTGWSFNTSMIGGVQSAGLKVMDLGIVPTPMVPYFMQKKSFPGGAVLTASHNPANQNGIKLFYKGCKLLPESELGDYTLSAWMYDAFLQGIPEADRTLNIPTVSSKESLDFLIDIIPSGISDLLSEAIIILDNANGAYADLSKRVLDFLKLNYICVNDKPNGDNINRNCGVSEIEGHSVIKDSSSAISSVQEMFKFGRSGQKEVYGIVLDGDGDRGFVLFYDKNDDTVKIIDGDKSGFITAKYLLLSEKINPDDVTFVSTVESDIMTSYAADTELGMNTKIVSVGDKWISQETEKKLLVGVESSGHIICPMQINNENGEEVTLKTGNGLFTVLITLSAIKYLNLNPKEIVEPFKTGFSKTRYTYFVNKNLFYNSSAQWLKCEQIIKEQIESLKKSGKLPHTIGISREEKEDKNMLYFSITDKGFLAGVIFCRNSGTEDKFAVYVKCRNEYGTVLTEIGKLLQDNSFVNLKNINSIEFLYEKAIIDQLQQFSKLDFSRLLKILEQKMAGSVNEKDLRNVVYGLKKEGRVTLKEDEIYITN